MIRGSTRIARRALTIFAAGLIVAAVPALAATVQIKSSVKITNEGSTFKGVVKASNSACKPGRTVKLFRVQSGRDPVLDKDKTNAKGRWRVDLPGFATASMSTFYYARVKQRTEGAAGTTYVCGGDRSKSVAVAG